MSGNLSIATNSNNDIYVDENGNLAMVTGVDAVKQDCEHAMKAQFGEMFLQPLQGLPNLADVWRTQNFIKWEGVARATLAAINGVVRVVSFVIQPNGDTLNYTAQILTIYSATLIQVSGVLDKPI